MYSLGKYTINPILILSFSYIKIYSIRSVYNELRWYPRRRLPVMQILWRLCYLHRRDHFRQPTMPIGNSLGWQFQTLRLQIHNMFQPRNSGTHHATRWRLHHFLLRQTRRWLPVMPRVLCVCVMCWRIHVRQPALSSWYFLGWQHEAVCIWIKYMFWNLQKQRQRCQ